jgi:hypothetical protein
VSALCHTPFHLLIVIPAVVELAPAAIGRGGDPSEEKGTWVPPFLGMTKKAKRDRREKESLAGSFVIPAVCGGDPSEEKRTWIPAFMPKRFQPS